MASQEKNVTPPADVLDNLALLRNLGMLKMMNDLNLTAAPKKAKKPKRPAVESK